MNNLENPNIDNSKHIAGIDLDAIVNAPVQPRTAAEEDSYKKLMADAGKEYVDPYANTGKQVVVPRTIGDTIEKEALRHWEKEKIGGVDIEVSASGVRTKAEAIDERKAAEKDRKVAELLAEIQGLN